MMKSKKKETRSHRSGENDSEETKDAVNRQQPEQRDPSAQRRGRDKDSAKSKESCEAKGGGERRRQSGTNLSVVRGSRSTGSKKKTIKQEADDEMHEKGSSKLVRTEWRAQRGAQEGDEDTRGAPESGTRTEERCQGLLVRPQYHGTVPPPTPVVQ